MLVGDLLFFLSNNINIFNWWFLFCVLRDDQQVATWCIVILILCKLEVVTEKESIFHVAP